MIHYHKQNYNCAHYAVDRLNEIHGLSIEFANGDEWQLSFIEMLRESFKPSKTPSDGCLVVMSNHEGSLHVGVFNSWHVEHNYRTVEGDGSVIKSDMGTIRAEFKRVRFYEINQEVHQRN